MKRATNQEVIAAYKQTGSVWKAAEFLGLCGQSVHERLVRLDIRMANEPWTPEERDAAKSLAEQGIPICKIAEQLGRTYAAVACELSALSVKHAYHRAGKIKRGFTKDRIVAFAKYILSTDISVTKAARQNRLATTGLVYALQRYAPDMWALYVKKHSDLKPKNCPGCGLDFIPLAAKQKYCTAKCGNHARMDIAYFGGNRRNAIGLHEGVCQLCLKVGKTLSVHHLFGKRNDPENTFLIALCAGCHNIVGLIAAHCAATQRDFWENLISLVVARALADKGERVLGTHICVDIEKLTEEEVRDEISVQDSTAHRTLELFE